MLSRLFFVLALWTVAVVAFLPKQGKLSVARQSQLFERFNPDFKNPKIESDKLIFSEKQLREFTATYSVDNRINPIEFILNIFKKSDDAPAAASVAAPVVTKSAPVKAKAVVAAVTKAVAAPVVVAKKTSSSSAPMATGVKGSVPVKKIQIRNK